jgi:hypothetical protein
MQMSLRMRSNCFFLGLDRRSAAGETATRKVFRAHTNERRTYFLPAVPTGRVCVIQNANNPARGDCGSELIHTAQII